MTHTRDPEIPTPITFPPNEKGYLDSTQPTARLPLYHTKKRALDTLVSALTTYLPTYFRAFFLLFFTGALICSLLLAHYYYFDLRLYFTCEHIAHCTQRGSF